MTLYETAWKFLYKHSSRQLRDLMDTIIKRLREEAEEYKNEQAERD